MSKQNPIHDSTEGIALVVDDDPFVVELVTNELNANGIQTLTASNGAEAIKQASSAVSVVILDLLMPRMGGRECLDFFRQHYPEIPVIILSAKDSVEDATEALRGGAFHYLTKPFSSRELLSLIKEAFTFQAVAKKGKSQASRRSIVARPRVSFQFEDELAFQISRVAQSEAAVLITGESGTGKSSVARRIHDLGNRASGPFVSLNCASLPKELFESELFGYEKGAFTGANQSRKGKVDAADGGTLFLDEVGDLPLEMQPKLLTFLQNKSYYPVGSNSVCFADTRIIAATHQNLEMLCGEKKFREDLYYRISVLELSISPLREKNPSAFRSIAQACIDTLKDKYFDSGIEVEESLIDGLYQYDWPGNIRQLENCLERAFVFCDSKTLTTKDIDPGSKDQKESETGLKAHLLKFFDDHSLQDLERLCYEVVLEESSGNRAQAARRLGVSERTVFNKLKQS